MKNKIKTKKKHTIIAHVKKYKLQYNNLLSAHNLFFDLPLAKSQELILSYANFVLAKCMPVCFVKRHFGIFIERNNTYELMMNKTIAPKTP